MVGGEAGNQLDRVLVGAVAFGPAAVEPRAELGARAALPDKLDRSALLALANGHNHLGDQHPQQFLAVAVAGRRRAPEPRQVPRQPAERASLVIAERRWAGALERGEFLALALDDGQRLLERGLQRPADESVLGLAGVELAPRAIGLEFGALQRESLAGQRSSCWRSSSPTASAEAAIPAGVTASRNAWPTALSPKPAQRLHAVQVQRETGRRTPKRHSHAGRAEPRPAAPARHPPHMNDEWPSFHPARAAQDSTGLDNNVREAAAQTDPHRTRKQSTPRDVVVKDACFKNEGYRRSSAGLRRVSGDGCGGSDMGHGAE
jgi:hypothetical protein